MNFRHNFLVAAMAAGTLAITGASISQPDQREAFYSLQAGELAPITKMSASAKDTLPNRLATDLADEVRIETSRRIGTTEHAEYWIVSDNAEQLCMAVMSAQDPDVQALACRPREIFHREGVILELQSPSDNFVSQLVPANVTKEVVASLKTNNSVSLVERGEVAVVSKTLELKEASPHIEIPRNDGTTFEVLPSSLQ